MLRAATIAILSVLSVGCGPSRPGNGESEMKERERGPWTLTYADGSGNTYRIQGAPGAPGAQGEYDPVTPAMSSSGVYSGGDPWKGRVDEACVDEVWNHVLKLEADTSIRADTRMMGTGSVRIVSVAGGRDFLVRRCPRLQEFEETLAALRRSR